MFICLLLFIRRRLQYVINILSSNYLLSNILFIKIHNAIYFRIFSKIRNTINYILNG